MRKLAARQASRAGAHGWRHESGNHRPYHPQRSGEIAKVIDAFVSAYQTADLDERVARGE